MGSFFDELWADSGSITASRNIDLILSSAKYLPLPYWRKNFLFSGAKDEKLLLVTRGEFPATLKPEKTRPLFCLSRVPSSPGFKVCPCSTQYPFGNSFRYIPAGCKLLHTGRLTDKTSFLVEAFTFPIPQSIAMDLSFRGEVPESCLRTRSGN
jgi:hypothetical protein